MDYRPIEKKLYKLIENAFLGFQEGFCFALRAVSNAELRITNFECYIGSYLKPIDNTYSEPRTLNSEHFTKVIS